MAVGAIIDNGEGTKELSEILKSVRKEASSLEKQGVIRVIKSTLMDDLSDKLFQSEAYKKRDMNGGFVEQPSRNAFQADTMMAYRVMKGDTDMVYSNDSVFRVYLGPEFCYIKLTNMKTKDAKFDLAGVGNELMAKIENVMKHENNAFYKKPNIQSLLRRITYSGLSLPLFLEQMCIRLVSFCERRKDF